MANQGNRKQVSEQVGVQGSSGVAMTGGRGQTRDRICCERRYSGVPGGVHTPQWLYLKKERDKDVQNNFNKVQYFISFV